MRWAGAAEVIERKVTSEGKTLYYVHWSDFNRSRLRPRSSSHSSSALLLPRYRLPCFSGVLVLWLAQECGGVADGRGLGDWAGAGRRLDSWVEPEAIDWTAHNNKDKLRQVCPKCAEQRRGGE